MISLPEKVLQSYLEALRSHFKLSESVQADEKLVFNKQLTVLNSRLARLKSAFLDGDFTSEEYRTEKQNIQLEQQTIEKRISELSTDTKEIEITMEYLLKLVSKVSFLYESSRIDRKRKILKLIFSNFFLNGSNLSYV